MLHLIWAKICISAAINTTNLLTRGFCDDLIHDERMARLAETLFDEVISVARAIGVSLPFTGAERVKWAQGRFPHCKFSMLQVRTCVLLRGVDCIDSRASPPAWPAR